MKKRKTTILALFCIPLISIMIIQSILSYGTVFFGGTGKILNSYASETMNQTVENRKLMLENNMVQHWMDVSEENEKLQENLVEILKKNQITAEQFQKNEKIQKEFLSMSAEDCLYQMRKNVVTGAFIILNTGEAADRGGKCKGIYFRDTDPNVNSADYSDVLLERGSRDVAHGTGIALDSYWTADFTFQEEGNRKADDFFYKPYRAAQENPNADYIDLGYWSSPFSLNEDKMFPVVTYSVPFIFEGTVIGVLGMEISCQYIGDMLPADELNKNDSSGYLLVKSTKEGEWNPMLASGILGERVNSLNRPISVEASNLKDVYTITTDTGEEKLYASAKNLHLYNTNTPFEKEQWILVGLQREDAIFGIGNAIMWRVLTAVLLAALFGVIGIYLVSREVTNPIRRLAECIRSSSGKSLQKFEETKVKEVDELYDVVKSLTDKQEKSEMELIEEKERYRIAMQSSEDIFITYDRDKDVLEVFNFPEKDKKEVYSRTKREKEKIFFSAVHPEDRMKVRKAFFEERKEISLEFRATKQENKGDYYWVWMRAEVLTDEKNKMNKVIGSIRNIQEQKLQELRELELTKKDPVTRLHNQREGRKYLLNALRQKKKGCLALLDLDEFKKLNETYGLVFGDVILEEIGVFLLEKKKEILEKSGLEILIIRQGGDEILVWLDSFSQADAAAFLTEVMEGAKQIYAKTQFSLHISAGACMRSDEVQDYSYLLQGVRHALAYAKNVSDKRLCFYQEVPKRFPAKEYAEINGIASITNGKPMNITSLALNLFDKGGDVQSVISVLLIKLGRYFGASDIIMTFADRDFRTTYISYQWHEKHQEEQENEIRHFSQEQYVKCLECFSESVKVLEPGEMTEVHKSFLAVAEGKKGLNIPMNDAGQYMGSFTAYAPESAVMWKKKEQKDLEEVAKIIESNVNKIRYDQASKAKSEFLSRMSHEIRTPMNAVMGLSEIALQEEGISNQTRSYLQKINQSSDYLLTLINDILDMSKIESGKMKLEENSFHLGKWAEDVFEMIQPQAEKKEIELKKEFVIHQNWVKGDALRLQQVLMNLLSNALKFTGAKGTISFTVTQKQREEKKTEVYFSVKDTGIGIEKEAQKRIFQSFEQADSSIVRKYGGTGLGLAISSQLVQMMDGEIQLDSTLGYGSHFYFSVVLDEGIEGKVEEEMWEDIEILRGKRILLVEDNELNAEIAETILTINGLKVETAINGLLGLQAFAGKEPGYYDAILMDIRMPVMDGLEATKKIRGMDRADAQQIPIVAMTANAFDEDMKKSIESGMNGHLAKPINVKKLLKTLAQVLAEQVG